MQETILRSNNFFYLNLCIHLERGLPFQYPVDHHGITVMVFVKHVKLEHIRIKSRVNASHVTPVIQLTHNKQDASVSIVNFC